MTKVASLVIAFAMGEAFGVMTMCLMFVAKESDRWYADRIEVRIDAGRSGEQSSESCDQHIKADSKEHRDSSPDVPEAPTGK